MALHFLEHDLLLVDRNTGQLHNLELFEQGGQRFIRLWIGGIGENKPVEMLLDRRQAQALAAAAEKLTLRIMD